MYFVLDVARNKYPPFDESRALEWLYSSLSNPNMLMLRGDHGFGIAGITYRFYDPKPLAHLVFLAVKPGGGWEGYRLLASMIRWARDRGAVFHLGEDTGVDFGPWARRLGGKVDRPSYIFE